jgi:ABC-type Fe3+-siderophore transport system permease subunit
VLVTTCCVASIVACLLVGLLAGHTWVRVGDVVLWLQGEGAPVVRFALDERAPRVVAALVAGAALALAGSLVQATCRNPLAEPGLLGITAGAGLGAVLVTAGGASAGSLTLAATAGALASFVVVYALAWRDGLDADRLVLVGIGVWYGLVSVSGYLLLRSNPWDTPRIYTWMSGTTYGRTWEDVVPLALALAVALPLAIVFRHELDLLALDDDSPRLVGVTLERTRRIVLAVAAVLGALSVTAVGVVGFVGLVAPHMARALVGGRHLRIVPVAVLLGALLLGLADVVGRTVIAPAQLPAGLTVAVLGAPYFVVLLARSRASA